MNQKNELNIVYSLHPSQTLFNQLENMFLQESSYTCILSCDDKLCDDPERRKGGS
jgi:hypothetical protein